MGFLVITSAKFLWDSFEVIPERKEIGIKWYFSFLKLVWRLTKSNSSNDSSLAIGAVFSSFSLSLKATSAHGSCDFSKSKALLNEANLQNSNNQILYIEPKPFPVVRGGFGNSPVQYLGRLRGSRRNGLRLANRPLEGILCFDYFYLYVSVFGNLGKNSNFLLKALKRRP